MLCTQVINQTKLIVFVDLPQMEAHGLFDDIVAADERDCPLEVLVFGLICDVGLRRGKVPISKEGIIRTLLIMTVGLLSLGVEETGCSGYVLL